MAAVAITAPSRRNRLRRLAVERAMTEVAIRGRGRRNLASPPQRAALGFNTGEGDRRSH